MNVYLFISIFCKKINVEKALHVFHYDSKVYNALLLSDDITDQTVGYMLDDWQTYLDQQI